MQNAVYDTDLTDDQWRILRPVLPKPSKTGRPRTCLRRVINAILYTLKTGCQWASLPKDFPPKSTVHGHFRAWSRDQVIRSIHDRLRAFALADDGRRFRPTAAVFNSQTVCSAGLAEQTGYDGAKKTKGRKRFLLVDTLAMSSASRCFPRKSLNGTGRRPCSTECSLGPRGCRNSTWTAGSAGPTSPGTWPS